MTLTDLALRDARAALADALVLFGLTGRAEGGAQDFAAWVQEHRAALDDAVAETLRPGIAHTSFAPPLTSTEHPQGLMSDLPEGVRGGADASEGGR